MVISDFSDGKFNQLLPEKEYTALVIHGGAVY